MEKINIGKHERNSDYYNKDRDIETAIAYSSIRKVLEKNLRSELFSYIKSVRLTDKSVIITTEKPIANAEIGFYKEEILILVNTSIRPFRNLERQSVRFR